MGDQERGIVTGIEHSKFELPILGMDEVGNRFMPRTDVPDDIRDQLSEDEEVVYIHEPDITYPQGTPSAVVEIRRLTFAPTLAQLGEFGPSIASISSQENKKLESLTKYEVVHGRDALHTALHIHKQHPNLLRATIISLAEKQGLETDTYQEGVPFRQEEPGKIMLLSREPDDPIGKRFSDKLGWGWPFYGSIDATPLFVSAICTYAFDHDPAIFQHTYTDLHGRDRTIREALDMAVQLLVRKTDENPEGLLEYKNRSPVGGILNQAWKDSASAYVHADGEWANHDDGIASIEVQGHAYDAFIMAAKVYESSGRGDLAEDLYRRAERIKAAVLEYFWHEDERGGYFVLGTDRDENGNLRQLQVRTSNMGQLLKSQLLKDDTPEVQDKIIKTIRTIFSPEMLSINGLRTLSSQEVSFRPRGYHVGNVWLWDNDAAGDGMANHGYFGLAQYLWGCSIENIYHYKMFPEFVPGGEETKGKLNEREVYVYNRKYDALYLFEQIPQHIQAWSVSSGLATKYNAFIVPHAAKEPLKRALEEELLSGLPPKDVL